MLVKECIQLLHLDIFKNANSTLAKFPFGRYHIHQRNFDTLRIVARKNSHLISFTLDIHLQKSINPMLCVQVLHDEGMALSSVLSFVKVKLIQIGS
jgi:hypothetical protein